MARDQAIITALHAVQNEAHRTYLGKRMTREVHAAVIDALDAQLQKADPGRNYQVRVLGRDARGYIVARTIDGGVTMDILLTECCLASAKGHEWGIGCRACHHEVDSGIGGMPTPPYCDAEGITSTEVAGWDGHAEWAAGMVAKALGKN